MIEGVVYWKYLESMSEDYTDGYIGISKNFEERMKQHHRDAFVRNSLLRVHDNMRIYGDEVKTKIIFKGDYNSCLDYEEELRPKWHIGWNMAIGGGRPGSGWKPKSDWLDNRLWHKTHGEVIVNANMKLLDIVNKYLPDVPGKTGYAGQLGRVLRGTHPNLKGWELADAQLAQRVNERYYLDWNHAYLSKNGKIYSLYKSGSKDFYNYFNCKASTLGLKRVINGAQPSSKGWELATEEEWLSTKERITFK